MGTFILSVKKVRPIYFLTMSSNIQIRPKHSYSVDELLSLRPVTLSPKISNSEQFKRLQFISKQFIEPGVKPYNKNQGEFKTKDELCEEIYRNNGIGGLFREPIVVGKPNYGNHSNFDSDSSSSSSIGKRKKKTKKSSPLVGRKNQNQGRDVTKSLQIQKTIEGDQKLFNHYPNSRLRRQRLV